MGSIEQEDGRSCQVSACLTEQGRWNRKELSMVLNSSSVLPHWVPRDSSEHQTPTNFNLFCPQGAAYCSFIVEPKGFTAVYARSMDTKYLFKACVVAGSLPQEKIRFPSFHLKKKSNCSAEILPDTFHQICYSSDQGQHETTSKPWNLPRLYTDSQPRLKMAFHYIPMHNYSCQEIEQNSLFPLVSTYFKKFLFKDHFQ